MNPVARPSDLTIGLIVTHYGQEGTVVKILNGGKKAEVRFPSGVWTVDTYDLRIPGCEGLSSLLQF